MCVRFCALFENLSISYKLFTRVFPLFQFLLSDIVWQVNVKNNLQLNFQNFSQLKIVLTFSTKLSKTGSLLEIRDPELGNHPTEFSSRFS